MNYLLKILENVKNGETTPEHAEKQVMNLFGTDNHLNERQIKNVGLMLKNCAVDAYSAGFRYAFDDVNKVITVEGFEDWWNERNKVNLN